LRGVEPPSPDWRGRIFGFTGGFTR
jgi:hypothetical protein